MFESAELAPSLSKAAFKKQSAVLREELLALQERLRRDGDFPVYILVNGVEGAGKGETVNMLLEWFDARFVTVHAFGPANEEERERPAMWRYWRALVPHGRIGIYFGNWYTKPIVGHALSGTSEEEFVHDLERINHFEKELVDDGGLVLKFWFHLSKQRQRDVLERLRKDPDTAWRVSKRDKKFSKHYDVFREVSEKALRGTDTGEAHWHLVDAADRRHREIFVTTIIRDALAQKLGPETTKKKKAWIPPLPIGKRKRPPLPRPARVNVVNQLDLSRHLSERAYEKKLEKLQGRMHLAARELERKQRPAILAFEGVDAAGKGGAIRRITQSLDARQYQVIPIAAPTEEERQHPYLWRFWRHMPGLGKFTLFDRSWYGRVLVERIEGFCTEPEWQRAYSEITDFEEQLTGFGAILMKFYMVISPEEQLRRFKERAKIGYKRFKLTAEDWRNREKLSGYEAAASDMVMRTSTTNAPWVLVEAEDKYYARIKVLESVVEKLEDEL